MKTNRWRLPTINELRAMYDIENSKSIGGFVSVSCWSYTTCASAYEFAWVIYLHDGVVDWTSKTNNSYVRCVRELDNNILELSPSSDIGMTYYEAVEYAKNLVVDDKDIIKIKLNGLLYEEIKKG